MRDFEEEEILQRLGANIVRFRELRGWSRADLATLLGVTPRRLAGWETGKHQLPLEFLVTMSELMEIRVDDFVESTPEDPLPPLPWSQHPN